MAGTERETLAIQQIPLHGHALLATSAPGSESTPGGNLTAMPLARRIYAPPTAPAAMSADAVTAAGGSQPHGNVQPILCINYIISLSGTFPSPA
jgi:microcystin-dependent protein